MAKRKAEGSQRGGKAPARPPPTRQPPPPPPQDDSTDSDVCEIVKPPPSSNPPRQQPRPQPVGISSAASSRPQARVSGGFLSMMPGIPAAGFGLSAAGQGAHFGYHQASNGFNPYLFPATQLFPPQAGVQRGFFPGAPRSIPVGASSGGGGASSGASEVAPPRARVREGSAAQEVKEEPEDTLQPRPDEVEMVRTLRRYGVTTPDAVYSLRECGHRVEVALQLALDTAKTRDENKAMDDARLESEKEKDRAAERQSLEDKALKVLGEVTSHFPKSLLLNAENGCAIFRQLVERLSAADGTCTQALCAFREKATTLLFLERDAFRHYPESDYQIRRYFRKLSERLQDRVAAGRKTDKGGHAETDGESAEDRKTNHLTARVGEEVQALQQILYHFPKTPGGVPDAFLDSRGGENVATLEKDGVEEDHDRRSTRPKDPVVITIED